MGVSPRGIEVLHEDDQLVALVKPAGLPTANVAAGEESVYEWLRRRSGTNGFIGIVSRLDAPVSGVVVVAKTPRAAARLSSQFRERTVEKVYLAIVTGRFPAPLGEWVEWHDEVSRPPGDPRTRIRPAPVRCDSGGDALWRPALSSSRVVRRAGEVSLVELVPVTGRRHQLRVQLASRGCPIVGDRLYGSRLPFRAEGVALHASRIALVHPGTGRQVVYASDARLHWKAVFPSLFP